MVFCGQCIDAFPAGNQVVVVIFLTHVAVIGYSQDQCTVRIDQQYLFNK